MSEILDDTELYNVIQEITSGKKFLYHEKLDQFCVFIQPSGDIKRIALIKEEIRLKSLIQQGYLSENELLNTPELAENFFSSEEEEELIELMAKAESFKKLINKKKGLKANTSDEELKLTNLEVKISILKYKKNSQIQYTAEYIAREEFYTELFLQCFLNINYIRIYESLNLMDFTIFNDGEFSKILNEFIDFYLGKPVRQIRYIARHPYWKNFFSAGEKGLFTLFGKKIEDLSVDQTNLLAWSSFYTNVDGMYFKDKPDAEVINDDERLDKFLEEYSKKMKIEHELNRGAQIEKRGDAMSHKQVIVTANSDNYVKYHKNNVYSDVAAISHRNKGDSAVYDEVKDLKSIKKKVAK